MSRLNEFFWRDEFACKCGCGADGVDVELLEALTLIREHFCRPVFINSANRCLLHNRAVNGSPRSQHLYSKAADIVVEGISTQIVADFADSFMGGRGGIGVYSDFTHVDVRDKGARWQKIS